MSWLNSEDVANSADEYVFEKGAYNEGKKAAMFKLGIDSCLYPEGRYRDMWMMGYSYSNSIGDRS